MTPVADLYDREMLAYAANRGTVSLADGRAGQLVYWPLSARRAGAKARIVLACGSYISVPPNEVRPT